MRLIEKEIISIKKKFKEIFNDGDIYLFGSRVDDNKRGGDIDLFISLPYLLETKEFLSKKSQFRLALYDEIGEQKIDIVLAKDKPKLCNRKLKILSIIALKAHSLKIYTTNKVA